MLFIISNLASTSNAPNMERHIIDNLRRFFSCQNAQSFLRDSLYGHFMKNSRFVFRDDVDNTVADDTVDSGVWRDRGDWGLDE